MEPFAGNIYNFIGKTNLQGSVYGDDVVDIEYNVRLPEDFEAGCYDGYLILAGWQRRKSVEALIVGGYDLRDVRLGVRGCHLSTDHAPLGSFAVP